VFSGISYPESNERVYLSYQFMVIPCSSTNLGFGEDEENKLRERNAAFAIFWSLWLVWSAQKLLSNRDMERHLLGLGAFQVRLVEDTTLCTCAFLESEWNTDGKFVRRWISHWPCSQQCGLFSFFFLDLFYREDILLSVHLFVRFILRKGNLIYLQSMYSLLVRFRHMQTLPLSQWVMCDCSQFIVHGLSLFCALSFI